MKLSIIGTGFIAKRFLSLCHKYSDIEIQYILTRRDISTITDFPYIDKLTNDPFKLMSSDVVLELSNDANYAVGILIECAMNGIKIATYDTELHTFYGNSILRHTKYFTECLGDQPGSFAKLRKSIIDMDMTPIGYINYKRYMNHDPDFATMKYYSDLVGNSLPMTVSATDGTKVAFETCLIANAYRLDINSCDFDNDIDMDQISSYHQSYYEKNKTGLASLWIGMNLPKGICILSTIDKHRSSDLNYLGLVQNGVCIFQQNYHLCHYEMIETIRNLYYKNEVLLNNNGSHRLNVYSKSKHQIKKDTVIKKAIGSFDVRGVIHPTFYDHNYVPIVDLNNYIVKHDIDNDQFITYNDVEKI